MNFVNDADWEIVSELRRKELPKQVSVVETRSMVMEKKASEREEAVVMGDKKAGTSAFLLSKVESNKESDSDEGSEEFMDSMSECAASEGKEAEGGEEVVVQEEGIDLELPCLVEGNSREEFVNESLNICKSLADKTEQG